MQPTPWHSSEPAAFIQIGLHAQPVLNSQPHYLLLLPITSVLSHLQGFPSQLRSADHSELDSDEAEARRAEEARQSLINLFSAWALVILCCTHHFGHLMHMMGYHQFAHTPFMNFMGMPAVSGALGAFALLGPGRR